MRELSSEYLSWRLAMCAAMHLRRSHPVGVTPKGPGLEILASRDLDGPRCGPLGCHAKFTSDSADRDSMRLSSQNLDRNGMFSTPIPMHQLICHRHQDQPITTWPAISEEEWFKHFSIPCRIYSAFERELHHTCRAFLHCS